MSFSTTYKSLLTCWSSLSKKSVGGHKGALGPRLRPPNYHQPDPKYPQIEAIRPFFLGTLGGPGASSSMAQLSKEKSIPNHKNIDASGWFLKAPTLGSGPDRKPQQRLRVPKAAWAKRLPKMIQPRPSNKGIVAAVWGYLGSI